MPTQLNTDFQMSTDEAEKPAAIPGRADAPSASIKSALAEHDKELELPTDPETMRILVAKMLSGTLNGCLKELGYFPGQPEMFKQLRQQNTELFEETNRLHRVVDQQQHRIAELEHQLQRVLNDLRVTVRDRDMLAQAYERTSIEYRMLLERQGLPQHEGPPHLTPTVPAFNMGSGSGPMIPSTPGTEYIPRISHAPNGQHPFIPPPVNSLIPPPQPVIPQTRPRQQAGPQPSQPQPQPASAGAILPPPPNEPGFTHPDFLGAPTMPRRSVGKIRIPPRRVATMPVPVIDLTSNEGEVDDQEGARKKPRLEETQGAPDVPSALDMQAVVNEFERSVASTSAPDAPVDGGNPIPKEGDEDEDMDADDTLDEDGLTKLEICIKAAYEDREGKKWCRMCKFRISNSGLPEDQLQPMPSNEQDDLVEHLETVHPPAWKKLRGIS